MSLGFSTGPSVLGHPWFKKVCPSEICTRTSVIKYLPQDLCKHFYVTIKDLQMQLEANIKEHVSIQFKCTEKLRKSVAKRKSNSHGLLLCSIDIVPITMISEC